MNLDEYQIKAARTLDPEQSKEDVGRMVMLGLIGETGEVAELVKKNQFHGRDINVDDLELEAGDVAWYTATEFTVSEVSLSAIGKQTFADLDALVADKPLSDSDCIFGMYAGLMEADGAASANRLCMLARLLQNHGSSLERAAVRNIAKLEARYPNGFVRSQGNTATTTPDGNE